MKLQCYHEVGGDLALLQQRRFLLGSGSCNRMGIHALTTIATSTASVCSCRSSSALPHVAMFYIISCLQSHAGSTGP